MKKWEIRKKYFAKNASYKLKKIAIRGIHKTNTPYIAVQDSEKHYILCVDCEKLFYPHQKKKQWSFIMTNSSFIFKQLCWRSISLDLIDFIQNHLITIEALEYQIICEKVISNYLQSNRKEIAFIENHIFFLVNILNCQLSPSFAKTNPHVAFHRGRANYTFCNDEINSTITNILEIVFITLYKK